MARILWVDDQIKNFSTYADALRQRGHNVFCSDSVDDAIVLVNSERHEFDLALIDLRMPKKDGFVLVAYLTAQSFVGRIAVLSSYLYLAEYREKLQEHERYIFAIDKDFPPIDACDFETRFVLPIESAAAGEALTWEARRTAPLSFDASDPFEVDFEHFMALPIEQKDRLHDLAQRQAKEVIESAFSDGALWIMLCGSGTTIRWRADDHSQIKPDVDVINYARLQGKAPFTFFRPISPEDIADGWQECGDMQLSNYPTMKIKLDDQRPLLVHFDTGSAITFFSFEELMSRGAIRPGSLLFSQTSRGIGKHAIPFRCANLDIDVLLIKNSAGDTMKARIRGRAVRDWLSAPFTRHCALQQCFQTSSVFKDGKNCLLRVGLIGRNILVDNKITVNLDGTSKISTVL